jgi:hypothetical protein
MVACPLSGEFDATDRRFPSESDYFRYCEKTFPRLLAHHE